MSQSPDPHHSHGTDVQRLGWALGITAAFMVLEVVGGWLSGSLALLADAGHMLSDAASMYYGQTLSPNGGGHMP